MRIQWSLLDRLTQEWVRATGQRVSLAVHPWLEGPVGSPLGIGDDWIPDEAARLGGEAYHGGALIDDMGALGRHDFDPDALAAPVRDFYERTDGWRLDAWSQWSAVAWPFGWLLSAAFSRRLRQLGIPLRPLDVAHGMDSRVRRIVGPDGRHLGAAWLRTLRATGQTVYSGFYGTASLPGTTGPSVRVVFPLPNGSLMVFLRPDVADAGALSLTSPVAGFGEDGAYLVVAGKGRDEACVRRAPVHERFLVYVDDEGVLRTDHVLDRWRIPVIRLHYRLTRRVPV